MIQPISYSLATAVAATGMSRSHLTRAIRAGHLKARKSNVDEDGEPCGNWVILASDLQSYVEGLPAA